MRPLLCISFLLSLSGEFFFPSSSLAVISPNTRHLDSIKALDPVIIQEDIQSTPLFEDERSLPAVPTRSIRLDTLSAKELENLLKRDPDNITLLKYLGLVYGKTGKNKKASDVFEKILQQKPDAWKVRRKLGDTYYYLQKYRKAINAYQKTLQSQPDDISTHSNLGTAFFRLNDVSNAIKHFKKVLESDPDHLITLNNLGLLYLRAGVADEAVPLLERANRIDPTHMNRMVQLGKAYEKLGEFIKAESLYFKILKKDAKFAAGYNSLAEFYLYRLNQPESAVIYFKKSLSLAPNQPRNWEIKNLLQKLEQETN